MMLADHVCDQNPAMRVASEAKRQELPVALVVEGGCWLKAGHGALVRATFRLVIGSVRPLTKVDIRKRQRKNHISDASSLLTYPLAKNLIKHLHTKCIQR